MLRTAGLLAFLSEDFVSGLRRLPFNSRRRSATRRLGPYRDRTCPPLCMCEGAPVSPSVLTGYTGDQSLRSAGPSISVRREGFGRLRRGRFTPRAPAVFHEEPLRAQRVSG